ncbi:MAG: Kelch repeat-containing protein, partial [Gammaproteobacteria bacterium]
PALKGIEILQLDGGSGGDTTPPVIGAVQATSITTDSATITWTTDEASNSVVDYGTTTGYGSTASDAAGVTSHTVTLTGLSPNTLYHYRASSTDGSGNTATSADFSFTTSASSGGGTTVLYRVNAGGPSLSATPSWTADTSASPSPYVNAAATGNKTSSTSTSIDLTDPSLSGTAPPMALFQTERYDPSGAPEMQWDFPVTAGGSYEVRLYFAETFSGTQSIGARKFDVTIEGALMLNDYDVFADVGANKGVMKSFNVTSDATLNILLGHVTENPAVKGIEILQLGAVSNPNVLSASPASLNFGSVVLAGSSTLAVQLTNQGGAGDPSITVSSSNISGTNAGMFSSNFSGSTVLSPGQSKVVNVTFSPTGSTGPKSATISFSHTGNASPVSVPLSGSAVNSVPVSFGKSTLQGATALNKPTSLQFGPDGRLYVAQQNGLIRVYTVNRSGPNTYQVTATENITLIQSIPNHNDNGVLNSSITTRLVTGLLVAGTPFNPVIYVTSSDPRIGGGSSGTDLNLDTNSGMISRLTWNGSQWVKLDLVRGLPRSEENHAPNGMVLDSIGNKLYVPTGGNTNHGASSNNFALTPEFALSTALLEIDLTAIGNSTYDLPTLDDEDRPGTNDANDPFGGNDGKNQAKLVPGGPVQLYATGFRNAYDVVLTGYENDNPQFWTVDNGGNAGWGDVPVNEGPAGNCTNGVKEPGVTDKDQLHFIPGPGYYFGHPNPTRGNMANTFNASNPQSPVTFSSPEECDYLAPVTEDGAFATFPTSTNGLTQYLTSNFGGSMNGDLLTAGFDNKIYRLVLNASATTMTSMETLFSNVGAGPLDVTALDSTDPFPGTIWVADHGNHTIIVFEPSDFGGGGGSTCTGADNPSLDEDDDGFSNADEIDNGTDPCSAADVPPDWDNDSISNLNDPDDDNDGLNDTVDPYAIDPNNGATTNLPVSFTWENDAPNPGGLLSLGFTGLMTNHLSNYESLFDPSEMTTGGAAGVVTVDAVPEGDALGTGNNQQYAFQFGINVNQSTKAFTAHTRILAPFAGLTPQDFQSMGLFIGNGDQDNYFKIVVTANGVESGKEVTGSYSGLDSAAETIPGPEAIDLYLTVDPAASTVQASYTKTVGGATSPLIDLGVPESIPSSWLTGLTKLAVGIISTSRGPGAPFPATWDFIEVSSPWVSMAQLPVNLGEVAGGIIGNTLYLVGEGSNATLAYNISSGTWDPASTLAARSFAGNHHGAEVVNGKLYLIGGLSGSSEGKVQIYNPGNDTWTTGASAPFAAGSSATAYIGGKIYYAGGIVGSATVNSIAAYDPTLNSWSSPLAPMPQGVNHAASATDGSKLYVFGGRGGGNSVSNGFNYVQIYNPATNSWQSSTDAGSTIPPLPQARGGMGKAVYYDGEFYIIGGETASGAGATSDGVYGRVDIYDPVAKTWRQGSPMPTARHGIFPLLDSDYIYVPGGGIKKGFSQSKIHERYDSRFDLQ